MAKEFSYGILTDPMPEDEQFEEEATAVHAAVVQSRKDDLAVYGVWQNGTGEVLAIVHAGQVYRPE